MDRRKFNKGTKGNKGGNPGYGQMELIREKVEQYSPIWWKQISKRMKEGDRFALTEFNKLQMRFAPILIESDNKHSGEMEIKNTKEINVSNKKMKDIAKKYEDELFEFLKNNP